MDCAERVHNIMETLDIFEATFPNYISKSGYLMGVLIDLSCKSDEFYEIIDKKIQEYAEQREIIALNAMRDIINNS